jgi:protease-4
VGWQLPEGSGNNFVTWDLGATWRPIRWLGVGAVAQNLFSNSVGAGIEERVGLGGVVRPFGDVLYLSADYLVGTRDGASWRDGVIQGSARLLPREGLVLRASADSTGQIGFGAEVYFGSAGVGGFGRMDLGVDDAAPLGLLYASSAEGDQRMVGAARRVVELHLDGSYPYEPAVGLFARQSETYLHLLKRLDDAIDDENVSGFIVHLDRAPFSLAQVEELRALLQRARDAGKPVAAYLDQASSNSAYLLAAAADRVYLHPAGDLELIGLSAEMMFVRGALDRLGVEPQVAKRSEYKSSPEMFTNTASSLANREQTDALLDDLSGVWAQGIADGRGKDLDRIWELVDGGPYTAREAVDLGLVDGLAYPDELDERFEDLFVADYEVSDDYGLEDESSGWRPRREIAVITVTGTIVSGPSTAPGLFGGGFTAGSETVEEQLRAAGRSDSVKAVVLRVDSPGGSSFASDEIWRAVERLQEKDKPVVVSMGGAAASGGYYVSAGADAIFANPSTITGSIGVYAGPLFSLEGLFDKIGVETEIYTRGRRAAMYSLSKPMDPVEFAALDRLVGETYRQFKQRVADGRDMTPEAVEAAARGRVWSGKAALDQGLVDELGGFFDAVADARARAGIPDEAHVELVAFSTRLGPGGEAARRSLRAAGRVVGFEPEPLPTLLPPELAAIARWQSLSDERVWALMPYQLSVE